MCETCILSRHKNIFLIDHDEIEESISKHNNARENPIDIRDNDISIASDAAKIDESNSVDCDSQTEVDLILSGPGRGHICPLQIFHSSNLIIYARMLKLRDFS